VLQEYIKTDLREMKCIGVRWLKTWFKFGFSWWSVGVTVQSDYFLVVFGLYERGRKIK